MPSDRPPPTRLPLRDAREQAIAVLSEAFAHDVIGLDEFERRLTLVHRADAPSDIARTTADLAQSDAEEAHAASVVAVHPAVPIPVGNEPAAQSILAVFGGVQRTGSFTVPRHLQVSAILGGVVLDLRQASLLTGVTEIHVTALLGGVQLIVPPTLSVQVSGNAIMGGFDHVDRAPAQPDPELPVLRVHGFAFMGGVAIETRLPGESETDAHRRRTHGHAATPGIGPGAGRQAKRLSQKT
jgi:hypothetical protein